MDDHHTSNQKKFDTILQQQNTRRIHGYAFTKDEEAPTKVSGSEIASSITRTKLAGILVPCSRNMMVDKS